MKIKSLQPIAARVEEGRPQAAILTQADPVGYRGTATVDRTGLITALRAEVARLEDDLGTVRRQLAEMAELADRDPLLPVVNRRAFIRELTRAIALTRRHDMPASVVFFDIVGLKAINDRYGHAVGDRVLGAFVDSVIAAVRQSDTLGRIGGDEFGLILIDAPPPAAAVKAAALSRRFREARIVSKGRRIDTDAAYGVAALKPWMAAEEALTEADLAMYGRKFSAARAKQASVG